MLSSLVLEHTTTIAKTKSVISKRLAKLDLLFLKTLVKKVISIFFSTQKMKEYSAYKKTKQDRGHILANGQKEC